MTADVGGLGASGGTSALLERSAANGANVAEGVDVLRAASDAPDSLVGASIYAGTTTYSANDVDAGTGWLSSRRPSTCN